MSRLLQDTETEIVVRVTDRLTKRYPALTAEFAAFLAEGGVVGSLWSARHDWTAAIHESGGDLIAVEGWVWIDEFDVAYLIEVRAQGRYTIKGAARHAW